MRLSLFIVLLALAGCDSLFFGGAMDAVRNRQADPESVRFRKMEVCKTDTSIVMGEFNAKNAYGAYTGYRQFISHNSDVAVIGDGLYNALWKQCYKHL